MLTNEQQENQTPVVNEIKKMDSTPSTTPNTSVDLKGKAKAVPEEEAISEDVSATEEVTEDDPLALLDVPTLMDQGKQAFALKNYAIAQDNFSHALEMMCKLHGERAPECANIYYEYGVTLLQRGIKKNAVLGENESRETIAAAVSEMIAGGSSSGIVQEEGTVDDNDEIIPPADDEEGEDIVEDDIQLAWEILETARTIYSSMDTLESKQKLADCHMQLGAISMESEMWDQAIEDYSTALKIKKNMSEPNHRQIAEAHMDIALVLEYSKRLPEAMNHLESTLSVLKAKLDTIKDKENDLDFKEITSLIPEVENKCAEVTKMLENEKNGVEEKDELDEEGVDTAKDIGNKDSATIINDVSNLIKKKDEEKVEVDGEKEETKPEVAVVEAKEEEMVDSKVVESNDMKRKMDEAELVEGEAKKAKMNPA